MLKGRFRVSEGDHRLVAHAIFPSETAGKAELTFSALCVPSRCLCQIGTVSPARLPEHLNRACQFQDRHVNFWIQARTLSCTQKFHLEISSWKKVDILSFTAKRRESVSMPFRAAVALLVNLKTRMSTGRVRFRLHKVTPEVDSCLDAPRK